MTGGADPEMPGDPGASDAPASPRGGSFEAAALEALALAQAGRFADLHERFAPGLRALASTELLEAAWRAEGERSGALLHSGSPACQHGPADGVVVRIPLVFERGERTLVVAVGAGGWLGGLQVADAGAATPAPPWEPPAYADRRAFAEQEVIVGDGPRAVPGTLTLPRGARPGVGVVLLAGSGPLDRDSTVERSKPLKDLAWGLASMGIAVARFDKVTHAHPRELRDAARVTVMDEYAPQALAALALLREQTAVDPERVFLVGHSLGGTVAPRIAAADGAVAGLAILAGGAQPLQWAIVRQARYLASLDPRTAAAAAAARATLEAQARRGDGPDLTPATPARELPLGTPASYWLDLRAYDPVATAAGLGLPMLLLQGGRDYQATVVDDLARWRAGLAARDGVEVRVYPTLNHLLAPGEGPPRPEEYAAALHVDRTVVADLARWLGSAPARPPRPPASAP